MKNLSVLLLLLALFPVSSCVQESDQTIRDRFWLWGMKVNILQQDPYYEPLNLGTSTLTANQALQSTNTYNVLVAGGLPISQETLDAMPLAKNIICKTSIHTVIDGKEVMDYDECLAKLMATKKLAVSDQRVAGFLVDDFSTGSVRAGVKAEDIRRMQRANATTEPRLPLGATIYTLSLENPELAEFLPLFDYFFVPLWHADQIETIPENIDRMAELSGGKPMYLCLYLFDFGNKKHISHELMQKQLDVAEELLLKDRVDGLVVTGTCMMDLDWEANHTLYEWLERVGDKKIEGSKKRQK